MNIDSFHACATCIHFRAEKNKGKMLYQCNRLGFETKPDYQFRCWSPKRHVRKLMQKRMGEKET